MARRKALGRYVVVLQIPFVVMTGNITMIGIFYDRKLTAKKGEKNPVRLPYGFAKVQFIENIAEIKKMLEEGHAMIHVYRHLIEEGKITMSETSFKNLCRPDTVRARKERKKGKK